jgi:hypothetical protein
MNKLKSYEGAISQCIEVITRTSSSFKDGQVATQNPDPIANWMWFESLQQTETSRPSQVTHFKAFKVESSVSGHLKDYKYTRQEGGLPCHWSLFMTLFTRL